MKKKQDRKIPQSMRKNAARKTGAAKKRRQPDYKTEERLILNALKRHGEKGVASRTLMREAGVKQKTVFYDALRKLERTGDIRVDRKHHITYVPPEKDVEARLVSLSSGFGFARPDAGGEDVFIHGSDLHGAFVGDSVLLADVRKQSKGMNGRIKRVVERSKDPVTGTVRITEHGAYVTPDNAIRYDFAVRPTDLGGAKDGDKVAVKPRTDSRGDWTHASVKSVFGSGDSARICADAIIARCGIPYVFPKDVLDEAERIASMKVTKADIDARLDLRDKPVFTIDGADAKDLDDAISVEKTKDGYILGVHIADVAHYVKEGSALDREAFTRGTSVYFADRVIPMFPEALSNGICSLSAGTEKLTFSAIMHFDTTGRMQKYNFKKSVINSKVRGVYSEVNEMFAGAASKEIIKKYAPVAKNLKYARELASLLKEQAAGRGEMELESGEIKFVLDENGVCVDILPRTTGEAEELIEYMMISANTAAAKFAQKNELPFLYRVHESPKPERVAELCELLDRLGIPCKELKSENPGTGDFGAVLNRVKGGPRDTLVSQRVLRTMEKARYAAAELGHFGLALQDYSHFTSPIRRYPDTSIHRIMTAFLDGMKHSEIVKRYAEFAEESASESSINEMRAVMAERAAESCYVAEYMRAHIGERHVGVISGATGKGIFVRLENGAEGFVSTMDFRDSDFMFDGMVAHKDRRTGRTLMVGDELAVIVASSEVSSGRIDFVPAEEE